MVQTIQKRYVEPLFEKYVPCRNLFKLSNGQLSKSRLWESTIPVQIIKLIKMLFIDVEYLH